MNTYESDCNRLNFSRSQSNHNLSCYVDFSCDKTGPLSKGTATSSKKQKLDAILNTLKSFKNYQSTSDLHSATRLSAKYHNIQEQTNNTGDQSFLVKKRVPSSIHQNKDQQSQKYQLNTSVKNYFQSNKKEENLFSSQLKKVLSTDALKKLKSNEMSKNQTLTRNMSQNQSFCENSIKPISNLQQQKNSLEAIKQRLQKYGINIAGKSNQQSRLKVREQGTKVQTIIKCNNNLLKSGSNASLKSNQKLDVSYLLLQQDRTKQDSFLKGNDTLSRPLTSLKQKDVSFYDQFSSSTTNQFKNNTAEIRNSVNNDNDQKRNSPVKSITSTNSITSSKAHAKIFNLNMENFTGQVYHFGQTTSSKKPGSYGNNQKTKLTDSDDYGNLLKQKPGSYGSKKTLKTVFEPSSSFSKNSNISSYQIADLTLKQTIETDCTYAKLQRKLTIKDFKLGRQIGKGKFGRVFLCTHNLTGFLSAIKIIKKDMIRKERNIEQLIRQIKIQMYLNHSNSVKMYGFFDDAQNIYLLIEYCTQGQLYTLLKSKKKFQEDEAIPIIKDICQGLSHLHSQNIIHRDIKPENVVMSYKMSKLCDFGWSVNSQNQKRQTFCGTPLYVSPQLLMGKTYDYKVDIWALGIMVYELLTGKLPFHITNEKQLRKIVTNEVKYPEHLSENAKNFIQHLLQKNPNYRNDIETILKHKFIVEGLQRIKNKCKPN